MKLKQYPSINITKKHLGKPCIAFYKLDGSNLRAEWSPKRGWYKFGSRKQMIDANHEQFGHGIRLFLDKYGDTLPIIFENNFNLFKGITITVFFEYYGDKSFGGQHYDELEDMNVTLFDVFIKNKGQLSPFEFVKIFKDVDIPEIVYEGNYNKQFISNVRRNRLPNVELDEGVVVKGVVKNITWMSKIKTKNWLDRIKGKDGLQLDDKQSDEFIVNKILG